MWYHLRVGQWRRFLERIRRKRANVRFGELEALLGRVGFTLERQRGSHRVYTHPEFPEAIVVVQPGKDGKAKGYQVKQVIDLIDALGVTVEENDASAPAEDEDG